MGSMGKLRMQVHIFWLLRAVHFMHVSNAKKTKSMQEPMTLLA